MRRLGLAVTDLCYTLPCDNANMGTDSRLQVVQHCRRPAANDTRRTGYSAAACTGEMVNLRQAGALLRKIPLQSIQQLALEMSLDRNPRFFY